MSASKIKHKAFQTGYLACGVIPVNIFDEYTGNLDQCVKLFPKSKELYKPLYNLTRQPENAKSVIVCTQRYNKYDVPDSLNALIGKVYLFDPRPPYAYEHRAKLEFEAYLKTLGLNILNCYVPARLAAAKAGLGKIGRNNFLYDPQHGSYIWIDTWVVDSELEYDGVEENIILSACNDECNKCIEACPTKAMTDSLLMDRGRCVTHLSTNAKDTLDDETRTQMGQWLYGCDACQDACPLNKDKFSKSEEYPLLADYEEYLKPERILEMNDDTYINIINPRFWYASEGGAWLWKCNALRSMINSGDRKYHGFIKQSCGRPDSRIREVAQWGCRTLGL